MSAPPIGVVGGGHFGWGLARAAERAGRRVLLWSRRPQRPGTEAIHLVERPADLAAAELIFFAAPSPHVAALARDLADALDGGHFLVHISRGLIGDDLVGVSQVLRAETPCRRVGALAGPLVASALLAGKPSGGVVASRFPEVRDAVTEAIGGTSVLLAGTDDVAGAEFASAAVGLLSMALGFAAEVGHGPAAQAMLATRGMNEAARLAVTLGGREETFMGLAGYGDLLAAVVGDGRPEIAVGHALARGESAQSSAYNEGVGSARRVAAYARRLKLDAPVLQLCARAFSGELSPAQAGRLFSARQLGED